VPIEDQRTKSKDKRAKSKDKRAKSKDKISLGEVCDFVQNK